MRRLPLSRKGFGENRERTVVPNKEDFFTSIKKEIEI